MKLFIHVDDLHPQMLYHLYDARAHVAAVHTSRRMTGGPINEGGGPQVPFEYVLDSLHHADFVHPGGLGVKFLVLVLCDDCHSMNP